MLRFGLYFLSLLVSGSIFASAPPQAQSPTLTARPVMTTDSSRQIVVSGDALESRIRFMHAAADLRTSVLNALNQPSSHYPVARPILLVLAPSMRKSEAPHLQVVEDPGGIKLQINLSPEFDTTGLLFSRTLIHALLVELYLRPQNHPTTELLPVPPRWLIDALHHRFQYPDLFLAIESLQPILDGGQIPSLSSILIKPDSDGTPSSGQDESIARCLLTLLMAQPEARTGITALLHFPRDSHSALSSLLKHFPSLGSSDADLQRQWTLHLASFGTLRERVILTGPQTLRELNRLLEIDLTDASGAHSMYPIERFSDYLRLEGIRGILTCRQLELLTLLGRGHFYYSETIKIFADACGALAEGRTKGLSSDLKRAIQLRDQASARLERIHDYLNWFEAEQAPEVSPRMLEIYRMWDEIEPPKKNRYVSKALDDLEQRLKKETEEADIERALRESSTRSKNQR